MSSPTIDSFCKDHHLTKSKINSLRLAIAIGIANTSVLQVTSQDQHLWSDGEDVRLMYRAHQLLGELVEVAPV